MPNERADDNEDICFARSPFRRDDYAELRVDLPKVTLGVIDAEAIGNDESRAQLTNRILIEWAERRVHVASLISKVTRGNPDGMDTSGAGGITA